MRTVLRASSCRYCNLCYLAPTELCLLSYASSSWKLELASIAYTP
jgi:hypothetical protein